MPSQYKLPSLSIREDWFPRTEEGKKLYQGLSSVFQQLNRLLFEIDQDKERILLEKEIAAPADNINIATIYLDSADGDLKIKFANNTVKTLATN